MARAIWTGSISFGLVQIPVGLYTAVDPDELHLTMLDRRDHSPIHYQRINESKGEPVRWEDVVKGYKTADGQYIILSKEDLKRANVEATQTVDIIEFVDESEVEPLYFDRPYYLAPTKAGRKAYALLRETLRRTKKVGIARVVIRTRQHVAAMYVRDDVLLLDLLRYAHEIRDAGDLDVPGRDLHALGVTKRELDMAQQLVDGMIGHFRPEEFRDDYRDDLMKMIEEREAKGEVESPPGEAAPRRRAAKVVDIADLLKKSLEGAKKKSAPRTKKPAAKKRSRKRAA